LFIYEFLDFILKENRFAIFDIDSAKSLVNPKHVFEYEADGFSLWFVSDELVGEHLPFIDLVVVNCHGNQHYVLNLVMVSEVGLKDVLENEALGFCDFARSFSSVLKVIVD
jgi:hypothetical protein